MARKPAPSPALFDVDDAPPSGPGPVYQGVAKSIRALADRRGPAKSGATPAHPDRVAWLEENAGAVAAARSLGASIDRVSGHTGHQASGMQLASLHASLLAWLERLDPLASGETNGVMDELTRAFQDEEDRQRARAAAPHPPQ
jgi:hypothetical protein